MHTIKGFSGRDCILVMLFQLYDSRTWLFDGNLFFLGPYDLPQPSYWKKN